MFEDRLPIRFFCFNLCGVALESPEKKMKHGVPASRIISRTSDWLYWLALAGLSSCLTMAAARAESSDPGVLSSHEQLAEDILRELVEFESTSERPDQTRLAADMRDVAVRGAESEAASRTVPGSPN